MIYPMAFLKGIGNKSVIDSAFSNAEFGFNKMPIRMLRPYCLILLKEMVLFIVNCCFLIAYLF